MLDGVGLIDEIALDELELLVEGQDHESLFVRAIDSILDGIAEACNGSFVKETVREGQTVANGSFHPDGHVTGALADIHDLCSKLRVTALTTYCNNDI